MALDDQSLAAMLPQAGGNSLPGQAAAAAPGPPDPTEALHEAVYGQGGAAAADRLRASAPPPPPPLPPVQQPQAAPQGPPQMYGVPMQNIPALGALAAFQHGDIGAGIGAAMRLQQMGLSQALMGQQLQQRAQTMATNDFAFLDKLKTVPIQTRAALLDQYFAEQGRPIPPAMAHLLSDQRVLATMTSPDIQARLQTDPSFAQTYWYAMDKPKEFLTLHDDVQKAHAETTRAINEASASQYAPAQARATLAKTGVEIQSAKLGVQQKQMEIDSFYADQKKAVDLQARKLGMQPGTPDYTSYTNDLTAALDAKKDFEKVAATNQANLQGKPLSPAETDRHMQFANIAAFMKVGLEKLQDPTIRGNRGLVEGRLRTLAREIGISQGDEDIYQTMSNLGGIMSTMQFPARSRAFQYVNWLRDHTPAAGDQPALTEHRMRIMWALAHESDRLLLQGATTPAAQLEPTAGPTIGEVAAPSGTPTRGTTQSGIQWSLH